MASGFSGLRKVPAEPAAALLDRAGFALGTPLDAPAHASVAEVLTELWARAAQGDVLRLLSAALPMREGVWWACLAARDRLPAGAATTPCLEAAEAWVRAPGEAARQKAAEALASVRPRDATRFAAMAALYSEGTAGTGDLAAHPVPKGAARQMVLAANLDALCEAPDPQAQFRVIVARGLDLARGGNGQGSGQGSGQGGGGRMGGA